MWKTLQSVALKVAISVALLNYNAINDVTILTLFSLLEKNETEHMM